MVGEKYPGARYYTTQPDVDIIKGVAYIIMYTEKGERVSCMPIGIYHAYLRSSIAKVEDWIADNTNNVVEFQGELELH